MFVILASVRQKLNSQVKFRRGKEFVRADGVGFWDFLAQQQIEHDKADFPFLTKEKVPTLKRVFDLGEYLSLKSRGEALAYLYRGMGRALNYVGPVLDRELEHGFNDHTDRHTLWVSQTGVELLQRAGVAHDGKGYFDAKTEVLMTLVGMLHDVGNFLGRGEHSGVSVWMLEHLFERGNEHKREWKSVVQAILFHEEPVLKQHPKAMMKGTPLQWALILADKMHVGRERIGGRSFESGIKNRAFEADVHILLNSLIVRSSWHIASGAFVWHMDFSVDQLEDKFASFTKGSGRLWVPKFIQKRFLDEGKKYRETFAEKFKEMYGGRMKLAAESAFLLFPYLKRFEVRLSDTDTRGKVESGEMKVWGERRRN